VAKKQKRWQCRIIEIDGDEFSAELEPDDHDGPTLVADLPTRWLIGDVGEGEAFILFMERRRRLFSTVAIFTLAFPLLPRWTAAEIAKAKAEADRLYRALFELTD
jgi:hypothetical protein